MGTKSATTDRGFLSRLGEQMGQAIARGMDFDAEMLLAEKPYHCSCGRVYKTRGWFRKHYVRFNHSGPYYIEMPDPWGIYIEDGVEENAAL